jgi:polar amino acid transport system substrate-binding protein
MHQLTQKLNNGEMLVQEVPLPQLGPRMVLVKNHYSLISTGTESSTVKAARKSLIGKARERPQQVKLVIDTFLQQGPIQTYRAIKKKLDAYSPLGYSSAGEIMEVGEEVRGLKKGNLVACAGLGYAVHSEVVSVPINLVTKLDENADLKNASYNALGAIAMQSVRQSDLRLGETCVVIGLGLLGQLVCLLLKASGIRVIGVDINDYAIDLAARYCTSLALNRNSTGIEEQINRFTEGIGADAVIIAAATNSMDPINFSGAIARKKGKVVVLGTVPTGFDRDPYWYSKELELKMSCSYGPGRYDYNYEEKGIDYPSAYVRWTQKRNMDSFQKLINDKVIDIDYLTTHIIDFEYAPHAYDMILNKTEPYLGIVLRYDVKRPQVQPQKIVVSKPQPVSKVNIAFIGAGSYAQSNLLPNLPKNKQLSRMGILANSGTTSKRVAERFGFEYCTSDDKDIFDNENINTVFIATRHDSHADYVIKSLKSSKNVFVEKPLCINQEQLEKIKNAYHGGQHLMVGFNRRYSRLSVLLKKHIGNGPVSMIYRVNAGKINNGTWIQDMETGGGRIIGEVCHFIDYMTWLNNSLPVSVFAQSMPDTGNNNDTIHIQLSFANGSIGTISYYANGPKNLPKEYMEVYQDGTAAILDNFRKLKIYGKKTVTKKLLIQDKGQANMINLYFDSIINNKEALIPFIEIAAVAQACFATIKSLQSGIPINI